MAQMTIYLPDDVAEQVRQHAQRARMSVSAWIAELARREIRPHQWPVEFLEVIGTWEGAFPVPDDPPPEGVRW
ncbi:MAG: ribbon-helix-helix protein, CopG family [Candidatus Xenobia bacterium]